jgi:hypothetical protein
MHMSQSLFYLTTAIHISGVTITHLQEHKTTITTASGNRYTVIDRVTFTDKDMTTDSTVDSMLLVLFVPEFLGSISVRRSVIVTDVCRISEGRH